MIRSHRPRGTCPFASLEGLLVAALLWVSACRNAQPGEAGPTQRRVVSLHDVTTEIAVALGASAQLVGISKLVEPTPEVRTAVAGVPEVASLESVLAQRPDLVLGLEITREHEPTLVARLQNQGVQVYLARPDSVDAVYEVTRQVGALLNLKARAEALELELHARIEQNSVRVTKPTRVFVYDCCNPPFSAGGHGVLNQLISRAGGQNIFADLDVDWASVSWEEVLARRPELIVLHSYEYAGQADVAGKRAELGKIPGLARLPSVVLPLGCSLGGLRSAEGLERLRQALKDAT